MTKEEFQTKRAELKRNHELEDVALQKQFALVNNPFKIGDIVESYTGRILIDKIIVNPSTYNLPSCIYEGLKLKKDNTPFKKGERERAYQSNNPIKIA